MTDNVNTTIGANPTPADLARQAEQNKENAAVQRNAAAQSETTTANATSAAKKVLDSKTTERRALGNIKNLKNASKRPVGKFVRGLQKLANKVFAKPAPADLSLTAEEENDVINFEDDGVKVFEAAKPATPKAQEPSKKLSHIEKEIERLKVEEERDKLNKQAKIDAVRNEADAKAGEIDDQFGDNTLSRLQRRKALEAQLAKDKLTNSEKLTKAYAELYKKKRNQKVSDAKALLASLRAEKESADLKAKDAELVVKSFGERENFRAANPDLAKKQEATLTKRNELSLNEHYRKLADAKKAKGAKKFEKAVLASIDGIRKTATKISEKKEKSIAKGIKRRMNAFNKHHGAEFKKILKAKNKAILKVVADAKAQDKAEVDAKLKELRNKVTGTFDPANFFKGSAGDVFLKVLSVIFIIGLIQLAVNHNTRSSVVTRQMAIDALKPIREEREYAKKAKEARDSRMQEVNDAVKSRKQAKISADIDLAIKAQEEAIERASSIYNGARFEEYKRLLVENLSPEEKANRKLIAEKAAKAAEKMAANRPEARRDARELKEVLNSYDNSAPDLTVVELRGLLSQTTDPTIQETIKSEIAEKIQRTVEAENAKTLQTEQEELITAIPNDEARATAFKKVYAEVQEANERGLSLAESRSLNELL